MTQTKMHFGFIAAAGLQRPDIVIHLAWGGLPNYLSPRHFDIEMPAQLKFLRGLIASGLKTLVVAGTCFEYGHTDAVRVDENAVCKPTYDYAVAKALGPE